MPKFFVKFLILIILIFSLSPCNADVYQGEITEEGHGNSSRVVDKNTGLGIGGAKVFLPKQNYSTQTDSDGYFNLDTNISGTTILSVQKENYKPFSATINQRTISAPMIVGIEKTDTSEMVLDSSMYHLGDNNFSDMSANATQFRMETIGPFYTKRFILKNLKFSQPVYLVIGSIIGIDSQMAQSMGQNRITNAFSSPPEVFFNGNKIAEIKINGDGQRIRIPPALLKRGMVNEVTIKTGYNLMQTAYIDYDDIEFMNLFLEN